MAPEHLLAFVGFAVVMAGTPGPSNTLLTATGARVGVVRGLPALLGVAVGMGALMFAVVFGLGTLVLQIPLFLTAVKWAGAAVLLWLAWKIATSGGTSAEKDTQPIGFLGAVLFQWVNPKSWLACMSAAGAFLDQTSAAYLQAGLLALIFMLVSLPCCLVWLAFGAGVQRVLRSERARRAFNVAMGVLLAASVVLFIT